MAVRVHPFTCGWLTSSLANFIAGAEGSIRVPVPSYLIEHPRGSALFDSGLHPDIQHDPEGRIGWLAKVFASEFAPGEEVSGRLASADISPASVGYLINSHLHFDHTGGNALIPNAQLVVQR